MGLHLKKEIEQEITALILEYKETCLWSLREDCGMGTVREAITILEKIEKYGDREGFIRAKRVKRWLLQNPSVQSVK